MNSAIQNLVLVEMNHDLVAEADFMEHRIQVRCIYDAQHWCWNYHVYLVESAGLRCLSDVPSTLRTASRMGAVNMGMKYAMNSLLGIKQPSLMLMVESSDEVGRQIA